MIESLLHWDAALRTWMATHHAPWLDTPMWLLSLFGVGAAIWIGIAGVMAAWASRLKPAAWQLLLALLLAQLIVDHGLKPLVARDRPFVADITSRVVGYQPTTHSFPSGHTASSFAAATVLSFAVRGGSLVAVWLLAAGISFSRIYIGVHYPLDVAAGAVLGVALGVWVTGGRAWYTRGSSVGPRLVPR
jgi:undecaprenyl-diphosphatase